MINVAWAAALAIVAALVSRWFKRPALSHGLWLLVLIKLVTPSFVWLSTSSIPLKPTPINIAPPKLQEIANAATKPSALAIPKPKEIPSLPVTNVSPQVIATPAPATRQPWPWRTIVGVIWLRGSAAWLFRLTWQTFQFPRLLRSAEPADDTLVLRVQNLATQIGLRRAPSVWLVPARVPPMLWALVGPPRLLLPEALWKTLGESERETILVHELAHLKRRDHWVRRLEVIVLGVYWWNPIAWWARREVEKAEEACCDAWVAWLLPEALEAYAEALVATAVFLSGREVYRPLGASGAGKFLPLHERLNMIPRDLSKEMPARPASRRLLLISLLGLLILPAWGSSRTVAVAQDKPADAARPTPPDKPTAEPAKKAEEPPAAAGDDDGILVSQPIVDDVSEYIDIVGRIEAEKSVEIRARVTGTLDKIHSHEGMTVDAGTPLFEIDPRPYEAEFRRADAEFRGKQAKLKRAATLVASTREMADKGTLSNNRLVLLEADLSDAEVELEVAKATRDLAKLKLESTKITAPIRGKLSRVQLAEGSLVVADSTVLATISITNPAIVVFDVPEGTVLERGKRKRNGQSKLQIEPGLPLAAGLSNESDLPRRGVIDHVDTFDPVTAGLRCRSKLANPDNSLIPGLTARVRLFTNPVESKRFLFVNQAAVFHGGSGDTVCVVNERGVVEERQVKMVKMRFSDLACVRKGLRDTDWVVVDPGHTIRSEATIKPRRVPMPTNDKSPQSP